MPEQSSRARLEMEITVTLSDLRAFFLYTVWLKQRFTVPLLLFAAGVGFLLVLRGGASAWLGAALVAVCFWYIASRLRLWRRFRDAAAGEAGSRYRARFSGNALDMEHIAQTRTTKYRLDKLTEARETGGHFFLYTAPFSAVILPKRDLQPLTQQRLRELLRQRLGAKFSRL